LAEHIFEPLLGVEAMAARKRSASSKRHDVRAKRG
jgi:hypothetical protein